LDVHQLPTEYIYYVILSLLKPLLARSSPARTNRAAALRQT
jgi:hypothetical protein